MAVKHLIFFDQKAVSLLSLFLTLMVIFFLNHSFLILFVLLPLWFFLFRPLDKIEIIMFIIGSVFIIGQNYWVLKSGGFFFTHQDFLLMPYYEPCMWGFYYLAMKRFINESNTPQKIGIKPFSGLLITGLIFSFFSHNSDALIIASLVTTSVLLIWFHQKYDLYYAGVALAIGFIVEVFGVFSGNWVYPDPDILGIPYWFITMWISVGLLARRFLIPLSDWVTQKVF